MDYGWDTSDEEGGMAIDLDAKQDEHRDGHMNTIEGKDDDASNKIKPDLNIDTYDPSDPTDEYDPAEPTNDTEGEASSSQKVSLSQSFQRSKSEEESPEYDPAEPTLSEEEGGGTPMSKTEDSQTEVVSESDGRWDSQIYSTQNEPVSPETDKENRDEDDVSLQNDGYVEKSDEHKNFAVTEKVSHQESPLRTNKSKSESPSVANLDTDENTQNSVMDDVNSDVPEVSFDESDFVLEKEPFAPESEHRDTIGSPWSTNDQTEDVPNLAGHLTHSIQSPNMNSTRTDEEEKEERERFRRQEEVDSRNEEALVDLFREESEPDRIEEDLEQPIKKNKKKVGSKKVKKKGKKLKKGMGKKGQKKHDGEGEVEDQRFVEIRKDRNSVESREEGELEGEGVNFGHRNSFDDRLPKDAYEQTFSLVNSRQEEEQREPGEIVEESKKKSNKKREKKEKKKKKSKREVATIEEGNQGDDDSQKFPSFLAGFFVQDEGEEDVDENIGLSRSFDEEPTFQKSGVKNYRKRHSSGAEDSVKSFDDSHRGETQEVRGEEPEHRKTRKHDDKRQEVREVRQREARDMREVRHEKEHRHGTPRDKDRERERERTRVDRDRERGRDKERENREREREREREAVRERERSRRVEVDERRRRHTRSASREHRRRSVSVERVRRSRSRDRTTRHRRQRSKSRERSVERERERPKRKHRERSKEKEVDRRVRRPTHSRSRSPHRRLERASSNKENRDDTTRRRRRHARAVEDSDTDNRESSRRSQRRQRRERERSSSSSSTSGSSSESNVRTRTSNRYRNFHSHHSSDEGASSDVILVEPERIVINLDEEEDPPSRVDITHHNIEDDSTKLVDGESIPPPPELSRNARGSALIQINPAEPENEMSGSAEEPEGDATPTRDEHTDDAPPRHAQRKSLPESDYDPAHPTEEVEEHDNSLPPTTLAPTVAPSINLPTVATVPVFVPAESGPVPPDHPPPEEVRPSPPPGPSLVETSLASQTQLPQFPGASLPQLTLINAQFQQQPPPPSHQQPSPQHQPGLLPFPGVPLGQAQRFPPWPHVNGPNANLMHPNAGPLPGFANQRGLLPTPDSRPLFPLDSSRPPPPFGSALLSQPPPPRESMPLMRSQMPISAMAPLEQLTSLLPALDRAKMAQRREDQIMVQQMFKHPLPVTGLMGKAPLMSNSASNMSSGALRISRGSRGGGDFAESTEVVDMDMSPGEDDCELELPSPNSSDSDRDDRRRRGRKSDSRSNRTANDISKTATSLEKGIIQPSVYLKALSKVIEKLAPKSQPQTSESGGAAMHQDKSKTHPRKRRVDMNDDDVPASAVELTNKEKYLKKLHLQERVIDEVKLAIKPFYSSKKITKEQYKLILRKAVPKVCHSKSGNINPQKIQQLVEAYVGKMSKGGATSSKKKKTHAAKDPSSGPKEGGIATSTAIRQNGDRAKKPTR